MHICIRAESSIRIVTVDSHSHKPGGRTQVQAIFIVSVMPVLALDERIPFAWLLDALGQYSSIITKLLAGKHVVGQSAVGFENEFILTFNWPKCEVWPIVLRRGPRELEGVAYYFLKGNTYFPCTDSSECSVSHHKVNYPTPWDDRFAQTVAPRR